jgi:hypothetical protein
MIHDVMIKYLITALVSMLLFTSTSAQLSIYPQQTGLTGSDTATIVNKVTATGGQVIDNYYSEAVRLDQANDTQAQIASGVMTRATILNYAAYLIRFLSQLGMMIGAIMIIYAGYQYATQVFGGNPGAGSTAIKNAIT